MKILLNSFHGSDYLQTSKGKNDVNEIINLKSNYLDWDHLHLLTLYYSKDINDVTYCY